MHEISQVDVITHKLKNALLDGIDALGLVVDRSRQQSPADGGRSGLRLFGVLIGLRPRILDLRDRHEMEPTPLDVIRANLDNGRHVLANIPVCKCRHSWGCANVVRSPLTIAARALIEGDEETAYAVLEAFFGSFQPRSAADALGFSRPGHPFARLGPLASPLPWSSMPPLELERIRRIDYATDNANGFFGARYSPRFGPASEQQIAAIVNRVRKLAVSLQRTGYRRDNSRDGDIRGQLLIDDRSFPPEWALLVSGGGVHRSSVLAGRGDSIIPVRLTPRDVNYRSQVNKWLLVQKGIYSVEDALGVFDKFVAGRLHQEICHSVED